MPEASVSGGCLCRALRWNDSRLPELRHRYGHFLSVYLLDDDAAAGRDR